MVTCEAQRGIADGTTATVLIPEQAHAAQSGNTYIHVFEL